MLVSSTRTSCGICYQEMKSNKSFIRGNCNAICNESFTVHERCYRAWLERHNKCPNCNSEEPTSLSLKKIRELSNDKQQQFLKSLSARNILLIKKEIVDIKLAINPRCASFIKYAGFLVAFSYCFRNSLFEFSRMNKISGTSSLIFSMLNLYGVRNMLIDPIKLLLSDEVKRNRNIESNIFNELFRRGYYKSTETH